MKQIYNLYKLYQKYISISFFTKKIGETMKDLKEIQSLEQRLIKAAHNAGKYAKSNAFAIQDLQFKIGEDPVTEIDKACEKMIIAELGTEYNYLGEEFGYQGNNSQILIQMDPIDGTKSFVKGELNCATAITAVDLSIKRDLGRTNENPHLISIVYDFTRDITYVANTTQAYLITPQPENIFTDPQRQKIELPRILHSFKKQRIYTTKPEKLSERCMANLSDNMITCGGGVSLFMAQTAAGIYDAFHAPAYLKDGANDIADMLGGIHIMKQAGMNVVDYDGNKLDLDTVNNGILAWRGSECPFNIPKVQDKYNR
jgi:fructose-1,6-bisphosphatase/inositol monophosphatase family enzyme